MADAAALTGLDGAAARIDLSRMEAEPAAASPPAGDPHLTRRELQLVIRRAAELYAAESDDREVELSAAEVLRVGEELGLPARYVRQALFELPEQRRGAGVLDRLLGSAGLACDRVVPGEAGVVLERLQEYLSTEELLVLRRRGGGSASFVPAADTISNVTRALKRPKKRYHLARLPGIRVRARDLGNGEAHVRMVLDAAPKRRSAVLGSVIGGVTSGGVVGGMLGIFTAGSAMGFMTPEIALGGALLGGGAGAGFGVMAVGALMRRSFRRWCGAVRTEADGLLDRLEHGEPLAPPPAPWRRSLQRRLQT